MNVEQARFELGARVRRRRESLGLTIDQAADAGTISPVTWSRVELGRAVRGLSYGAVDKVLSWHEGACQDFLANGTEPKVIHREAVSEASPRHLQALDGGNEPPAPDESDLGDDPFPGATTNSSGLDTPAILNRVMRLAREAEAAYREGHGPPDERQLRIIRRFEMAAEELAEEFGTG